MSSHRRRFLGFAGIAAVGATMLPPLRAAQSAQAKGREKEVEAAEDLMREHGVLRRALLVYAEAVSRLSYGQGKVSAEALGQAAALFRSFGEDYHERSLEEKFVFPVLATAGDKNAELARILKQQHDRGREITDYVSAATRSGRISAANTLPLANALAPFVRMYEHHAAIEDTVIFPAWKAALSKARYHELSEQFEEIEHRTFGKDGFNDAVERMVSIEQAFDLTDLNTLTAPAPPNPAA
jgi:hemerythrin-like domain-containing protein